MKLYYSPAACSLAVHIALREAGLAFDLAKVDLGRHLLADSSPLTDVNPKNYVPALQTEAGDVLTEVAATVSTRSDSNGRPASCKAMCTAREQYAGE